MKSIKFVQWGSAVALFITVAALLVAGMIILFCKTRATIDELVKLAMVIAIFIGPEVLAAFFGNYLKRKQNGQTSIDQENNR